MAKIAFLGLGVMGFPMAGHIAAAGHDVTVYNRTSAKAEAWAAQHVGAHAATPAAAATGELILCFAVSVMIQMCWRLRLAMRGQSRR